MIYADISHHNGKINFSEFKKHVDGIIIRTGHGMVIDNMLAFNLAACKALKIPYAFYHYTEANTVSEAQVEAKLVLSKIAGSSPKFVAYDAEFNELAALSKNATTDIANAFLSIIKIAGYVPFIYTNENWKNNEIDIQFLKNKGYGFWYARYSDATPQTVNHSDTCDIWQYSETGIIPGNGSQYVDLSVVYNLKQPTLKCDTTCDMTMKAGATYTTRITSPTRPTFIAGNGNLVRVDYNGNSGNDHDFEITAIKPGAVGMYANGVKQFTITIK